MNSFINYIIESGISLGVLSLVYFLFLRNETFFVKNRFFLLLSVLFSAVLPLLHLQVYSQAPLTRQVALDGQNLLETVTVYGNKVSYSLLEMITTNQFVVYTYLSVVSIFLLLFLFRIIQIVRIIHSNEMDYRDGIHFVYISENSSPYSFLNYLFVSKNIETQDGWEKMLAHETEHIRQGHTIDVLLLELITVFQWFNPFFWLLKRVIKENHEYMADRAVLSKGVPVNIYKQVLVNQFIGRQLVIANNFNSSLIKSRLKMMSKIKSSKLANLKYITGGLVVGALLVFFACENKELPVETNLNFAEKSAKLMPNDPLILIDGELASKDAMDKLKPETIDAIAIMKGTSKKLVEKYGDQAKNGVVFIKLKNGSTDAKNDVEDEVNNLNLNVSEEKNEGQVFVIVEEMPEFPGGENALRKFIAQSIKYPKIAQENGIQGKVYVMFVVEKDGSVGNAKVVRGVDPSLDIEALRVVKNLPTWIPGKQKGQSVRVSYTVPINFVLQ